MKKHADVFVAVFTVAVAVLLLVFWRDATEGAINGLKLSAGTVIPSLFPFMVLSGFVSLSGIGRVMSIPLALIFGRVFRMPPSGAVTFLLSFVGGYPAGAKTISTMTEVGALERNYAENLFLLCINPGPAFVVTAVGGMMWGSSEIGWVLLISQLFATLIVAFIIRPKRKTVTHSVGTPLTFIDSFITAVGNACSACVTISGYIVLFAVISEISGNIMKSMGLPELLSVLISGVLEVTTGVKLASEMGGISGLLLCSFFIAFGGISVLFQCLQAVHTVGIHPKNLLNVRLAIATLSTMFVFFYLNIFSGSAATWSDLLPHYPVATADNVVGGMAIIAMSAIVVGIFDRSGR